MPSCCCTFQFIIDDVEEGLIKVYISMMKWRRQRSHKTNSHQNRDQMRRSRWLPSCNSAYIFTFFFFPLVLRSNSNGQSVQMLATLPKEKVMKGQRSNLKFNGVVRVCGVKRRMGEWKLGSLVICTTPELRHTHTPPPPPPSCT
jgi:hypothetical protein